MAFNFATTPAPSTAAQSAALKNLAQPNLVSQLYAGKPAGQTPPVVAASTAVPNQNVPVKNPFSTPSSVAAGNVATSMGTSLTRNTQSFNPATVGTFNTTPPPTPSIATPQMSNNVASLFNTPASQTATVTPATTQNTVAYTNPNAAAQQINTGVAGTPVAPTPPPTSTLTQTGQTAATLAQTSAAGSSAEEQAERTLENTSAASSPAATAAEQATAAAGLLNPAISQEAANIATETQANISNAENASGQQYTGYLTGGGGPIGLGRAGAVQNALSQYVQGQAAAETAALQGTSQQLTAAQQQATAEEAAGNLANTQQANIQSGETSAAGAANTAQTNVQSGEQAAGTLTQPSGTFPFSYSPATGTFSNGSAGGSSTGSVSFTGNPTTDAATVAQAVISGQMTYAQAQQSMNYAGSAANNYLNSAILAAGGNPENLEAQGAAQQSNVQTAGTTATQTASQGYQTSLQNYSNANAAYSTALQQAQNVQNILASTGINSSDSQDWNSAINSLSARLGSANQASYIAGLNELQQTYTSLLASVGAATPTVNGQQATAIFNPASTPAQIDAAITALNNAAYAKLSPLYTQVQQYQAALGTGTSNTSTAAPGGFAWNP
jgi:hypothetical protein